MSEQTKDESVTETPQVKTVSTSININSDIKAKLIEDNSQVRDLYITQVVQAKVIERVALVQKAMAELSSQKKELDKAKADDVKYDIEGKVIQEFYTKELIEKRKKINEKLSKVEKALSKALETADYSDLENILK